MKKLLAGVVALGAILYPFVVYFGLTRFEPRYLAIFLGLILLLKITSGRGPLAVTSARQTGAKSLSRYLNAGATIVILGLATYAVLSNEADSLKFYPVVISFSLLASFVCSLVYPPTIIERFARMTESELPPSGVRYTRNITLVWCGFFLCNGVIALYMALFASFATWALYNGLIAYVLIGCLIAGEYLYRCMFLKKGMTPRGASRNGGASE